MNILLGEIVLESASILPQEGSCLVLSPKMYKVKLRSYREAGGLCKSEEYLAFIPFIRWRLRQELRRHFALVAHGLPGEPEYAARQLRAFERLRDCHVSFA